MAFEFQKRTSPVETGLEVQSLSNQGKFTLTPVFPAQVPPYSIRLTDYALVSHEVNLSLLLFLCLSEYSLHQLLLSFSIAYPRQGYSL